MGEGAAQGREEGKPRVWLIGGPTASGKSLVALRLAARLGARVLNADAQQVYADLRLLTARPSPAEEARAPHRLYGVADAADPWSVGRWLRTAQVELAQAGPVVVVGGTGMYLRALTHGLAATPPVPEAVRAEIQARFEREGEAAFRVVLGDADPAAEARIALGDRQRLVRALAVAQATGRPLSVWQGETRPALSPGSWRAVVLEPERGALYARCDARLEAMLAAGVLDEVAALGARALDPELPAMKAVGYREFAAHLRGELSLAEAITAAERETRRYAKRQSTWFRNQAVGWARAATVEAALVALISG